MFSDMKLIIGGGISGLIYHFFHPEYKIITPDIGGLLRNEFTFLLHDTIPTRMLLDALNIPIKSYEVKIGFYNNGLISNHQTRELSEKIVAKKMSIWSEKPDLKIVQNRDVKFDYVHSGNISTMLEIDTKVLIERLTPSRDKIIEGSVILITPKFITYMEDGKEHISDYESILSTVPAPIFSRLCQYTFGKIKDELSSFEFFKSIPITYCVTREKPDCFNDKFHLIYYDDSKKFSRITQTSGSYAVEFTGDISQDVAQTFIDKPIVKTFKIPFGRIVNKVVLPEIPRIKFLGRFASWQWGLTTEHIIQQSIES